MTSLNKRITLSLDGRNYDVPRGMTVATLLESEGEYTRLTAQGQKRAPFCGMGICQECRVTINGRRRLACQTLCCEGQRIERIADERA